MNNSDLIKWLIEQLREMERKNLILKIKIDRYKKIKPKNNKK